MLPTALLRYACALALPLVAKAEVTVYGIQGQMQVTAGVPNNGAATTTAAANSWYTSLPVYNNIVLQAPALPNPAPPMQFGADIQTSAQNVAGLSIQHQPGFLGSRSK